MGSLPTAAKTMVASASAAGFRVFLMPIDAWKTTKQVEGKEGLKLLIEKVKKHPTALWQGAVGAMTATWVGHYPWFYTNNQLREVLPPFEFTYGICAQCSHRLRFSRCVRHLLKLPPGFEDHE